MSKRNKGKNKPNARKQPPVNTVFNHDNNATIARQTQQQITTTTRSGPLPAPEILQQYDQVLPGAAERIFAMAEKNSEHQRNIEMQALTLTASENKRGQIFGLVIGLAVLASSIAALFLGYEKTASIYR